MPRPDKYAPTHRDAPVPLAFGKSVRKALLFCGAAAAATGVAVTGGVVLSGSAPADSAATAIAAARADREGQPVAADPVRERQNDASRSDGRAVLDKKPDAANPDPVDRPTAVEDLTGQDPREIAHVLLPQFGFSETEFGCLDALYVSESGWDLHADNPTSSAYGIPQALTDMHDLPDDYMTNPVSQIRWGFEYIRNSYGTPCSAWEFKQANNWY